MPKKTSDQFEQLMRLCERDATHLANTLRDGRRLPNLTDEEFAAIGLLLVAVNEIPKIFSDMYA